MSASVLPKIQRGLPPKSTERKNGPRGRLPDGYLKEIGERIKHGEFVSDLSPGSASALCIQLRSRELVGIKEVGQSDEGATVYAVTPEWRTKNPSV